MTQNSSANARSSTSPVTPEVKPEVILKLLQRAATEREDLLTQLRDQNNMIESAARERAELSSQLVTLTDELRRLSRKLQDENTGLRDRVQRAGATHLGAQSRMANRPKIEYAAKQPTHVCEMGHDTLASLAMQENHSARRERLLREIMCVEGVTWGEAHKTLAKLDLYNERFYWLESLPYRIGITGAFIGAIAGTLLVFCKPVAKWYAVNVAGEDLPEGTEDINAMTTNQVGTWTWAWMEPMIGTASLVLLCCQFGRTQARKMCMKPYGEYILQWRADRLAKAFPQYDRSMVRAWAKHMPPVGIHFFPLYERDRGLKGPTTGL